MIHNLRWLSAYVLGQRHEAERCLRRSIFVCFELHTSNRSEWLERRYFSESIIVMGAKSGQGLNPACLA